MERPLYAFTDIHGNLELFNKVKDIIYKNNGYAYFLGDACDRGPAGYRIMRELLNDSEHFYYLKGNHEDLFVKAARAIGRIANEDGFLREDLNDYYFEDEDIRRHINNGGLKTLTDWTKDGCDWHFVNQIAHLPTWQIIYTPYMKCQVALTHSSPTNEEWENRMEDDRSLLWSRVVTEKWALPGYLIHGHIPCQHMPQAMERKKPYPLFYSNNTRIDLDAGTPTSKEIVLMNLIDESHTIVSEGKEESK